MSAEVFPSGWYWRCEECNEGNGHYAFGSDAELVADHHNKKRHSEGK